MTIDLEKITSRLKKVELCRPQGQVTRVVGSILEAEGPAVSIGSLCRVYAKFEKNFIWAEVVGFRDNRMLLMPLGDLRGIGPGSQLQSSDQVPTVAVGQALLGRVIDCFGNPIDGKGPIMVNRQWPLHRDSPEPMSRFPIQKPLFTGIKSIDGILTCGQGQRMGLFAGSGVGKSVLMGMIAKNTSADINVIALIGERGREIREFIDKNLDNESLHRSVVIAIPSDKPPMIRIYGALAATSIAEYFCDQGQHVLLMMDSVTRVAMASREIGLSIGEPPTTKGYTPTVFSFIPKLLERIGSFEHSSITGFYTVLVEGDDMDDPVADTMRSVLDGHIVLSRRLASKHHFPAVDILESVSRLMLDVTTREHFEWASHLREILAVYKETEDLINVGAYVKGSEPKIDEAIDKIDSVNQFLQQKMNEKRNFSETLHELQKVFQEKTKKAA